MEQAVPSPSNGWHACSRRCQLALDLTVRGTGYPPLHSPGDCNVVGVVSFLVSDLLLSLEKHFQWTCDSSLSFSWQKGDRPDNDPLSHAASRQKKTFIYVRVSHLATLDRSWLLPGSSLSPLALKQHWTSTFLCGWLLNCGNYTGFTSGTPALRSFIYQDVGEPTCHPCSTTGMMQDYHFFQLGATWDIFLLAGIAMLSWRGTERSEDFIFLKA